MTDPGDARLEGRHPEFARMSNRPGLGRDAMFEIASELMHYGLDNTQEDVPTTLRNGSKRLPLGRYLVQNLRDMIGRDKATPETVLRKMEETLFELRMAAREDAENPSLRAQVVNASKGTIASLEAREKIYRQRKDL